MALITNPKKTKVRRTTEEQLNLECTITKKKYKKLIKTFGWISKEIDPATGKEKKAKLLGKGTKLHPNKLSLPPKKRENWGLKQGRYRIYVYAEDKKGYGLARGEEIITASFDLEIVSVEEKPPKFELII